MKVRNIMFSGFAAAILMGTAHAATTPFEIASKAYVDGKFNTASSAAGDVATTVGNLANLNSDDDENSVVDGATSVVGALDALDEAVTLKQNESDSNVSGTLRQGTHLTAGHGVATNLINLDSALGTAESAIDALEGKVGNDSVSDQIEDALGDLGTKEDPDNPGQTVDNTVADALALKVNIADKATSIRTVANGASDDKWATEKAVATIVEGLTGGGGTVSQQIADALGDDFTGQDAYADVTAALADKQDKSDSTVDSNAVTAANHLTAGAGVATNLVALGNALGTLEGTVGDANSGLVQQVNSLDTALNDQTNGLAARLTEAEGDIDDLEATMGTGTLTGFGSGVDTVIAALNDLQANKLNKPIPNTCSAQSQHCVLHMDNTGALSWVDITVPYTETTGGNSGGSI